MPTHRRGAHKRGEGSINKGRVSQGTKGGGGGVLQTKDRTLKGREGGFGGGGGGVLQGRSGFLHTDKRTLQAMVSRGFPQWIGGLHIHRKVFAGEGELFYTEGRVSHRQGVSTTKRNGRGRIFTKEGVMQK
jgi:hypothetical protein